MLKTLDFAEKLGNFRDHQHQKKSHERSGLCWCGFGLCEGEADVRPRRRGFRIVVLGDRARVQTGDPGKRAASPHGFAPVKPTQGWAGSRTTNEDDEDDGGFLLEAPIYELLRVNVCGGTL
ncbi:hypothetical protein pipiens_004759 [Culex pipiens pipiens]|uniref:Uncharacterized protein n=1 Tax=Culex pipiens pipiens TaxID=38569 RepID=A0ABD1CF83_CULPP